MTSHLCNYDITEMPKQKQQPREKSEKLHEQVFSEERTAQVKEMEQQAEAIKANAALLLKQKLKRKREQKLAEQEKKNNSSNSPTSRHKEQRLKISTQDGFGIWPRGRISQVQFFYFTGNAWPIGHGAHARQLVMEYSASLLLYGHTIWLHHLLSLIAQ